jgi:hypothetical protein
MVDGDGPGGKPLRPPGVGEGIPDNGCHPSQPRKVREVTPEGGSDAVTSPDLQQPFDLLGTVSPRPPPLVQDAIEVEERSADGQRLK